MHLICLEDIPWNQNVQLLKKDYFESGICFFAMNISHRPNSQNNDKKTKLDEHPLSVGNLIIFAFRVVPEA